MIQISYIKSHKAGQYLIAHILIPAPFPPIRLPCEWGTLTNGGYCRDGEEERPAEVPPAQAGGVPLEGYATFVGLDDTLQRDNNMRSHKLRRAKSQHAYCKQMASTE